jgi:hypothetical protein
MNAEWAAQFDGFLSNDVTLESDILNIEEVLGHDREQMQALSPRGCKTNAFTNSTTQLKEFQEESSMCCVCWEHFLNEKQTRLIFLDKKQVMMAFTLPCLHLGHLYCLNKLVSMRCTQKCCGRCAAQIPEQLFGIVCAIIFSIYCC